MIRFYFVVLTVIFLFIPGISFSTETAKDGNLSNPYITDYPFKSAVIHYTGKSDSGYHGKDKNNKGREIVYIKGDRLAKVVEMSFPTPEGKTKEIKRLRIISPEDVYMIDLVDKKGIRVDNSKKYGRAAYDKLTKKEKKAFHQRMERRGIVSLDTLGLGKKIGTDTMLGRKCDVYESGKKLTEEESLTALQSGENPFYRKTWIWKEAKIPLKIITESMGSSKELVATKIEENVEIPDEKFEVPPNIKVTFDEQKSEVSKEATLARFNLYKTGEPMIIRVKAKKQDVKTNKESKPGEGTDKKQVKDDESSSKH